jgi:hypothetical protein
MFQTTNQYICIYYDVCIGMYWDIVFFGLIFFGQAFMWEKLLGILWGDIMGIRACLWRSKPIRCSFSKYK